MTDKTLYLIDGSAYIHRAFHAVRNLSNSRGMPTNAVFGFSRMLLALLRDKKPQYLAVVLDARGPTFRHEMYSDYKANRPPMDEALAVQIPYVKKVVEGLNLPMLEMPGYEADDIMGALAKKGRAAGFQVILVTGDKDFNQLIEENIVIWDPMKDAVRDLAFVKEKLGLDSERFIDVMALMGDASDNVPGVPGIGEKTAVKLIREFGSLEALYENLDRIKAKKQKEKLADNRDKAFLSKDLVTIKLDTPVEFDEAAFVVPEPDEPALHELFREMEFRELSEQFGQKQDLAEKDYKMVLTPDDLEDLAELLEESDRFSVDTETTSVNPMQAVLVGMSFSVAPDQAFYLPLGHSYLGVPDQLPRKTVFDRLGPILADPDKRKIGQNIKYDWIVLQRAGMELGGADFDTMVASYLINPSLRAHGLDQIARDYLNHEMISYKDVAGTGKKALTFDQVPLEVASDYAAEDADVTLAVARLLEKRLEEENLTELFATMEMPLVEVLKDMEMTGIKVDVNKLKNLSAQFQREMNQIQTLIYELAGESFNIASPKQLGVILFEKLGLPVVKKTKKTKGYSTDVSVLTELASEHELPRQVLRYRTLSKLKSTYTDALLGLVHPETGRVHTSFNQNVAATGRLSSSDPNLQNIPIRTEEGRLIREAFIPRPGWKLMAADYSQIELRILAHVSEDPVLLESYSTNQDVHTRTAAEVFELEPEYVSSEMRRIAKSINFGLIYGMGPFRLSNELHISQDLARRYMDTYFATYTGVKKYMDRSIAQARETGKSVTLAGRTRALPDINHKNRVLREAAERVAINTPIQGSAADLIKIAMINMQKALQKEKLQTTMLLTVHDELVFEVPPEEMEAASALVTKVMEGVWDLKVPLTVNLAFGDNWSEAH